MIKLWDIIMPEMATATVVVEWVRISDECSLDVTI